MPYNVCQLKCPYEGYTVVTIKYFIFSNIKQLDMVHSHLIWFSDCKFLFDNGFIMDGIYTINPDGNNAFQVSSLCIPIIVENL